MDYKKLYQILGGFRFPVERNQNLNVKGSQGKERGYKISQEAIIYGQFPIPANHLRSVHNPFLQLT